MRVLNQLARAEVSSDLAHHPHHCHVDVLGAAGMAAYSNHAHMAIFRIKYLNDTAEIESAKRLFIMWARRSMINRNIDPRSASRVGVQALTSWVCDVCQVCNGLGYQVVAGTPTLSDRPCGTCGGTGKNKVREHGEIAEVVKDLHERADTAVRVIQGGLKDKLGRE